MSHNGRHVPADPHHHRRRRTIVAVAIVVLVAAVGGAVVASRSGGGDPTVAPSGTAPTDPASSRLGRREPRLGRAVLRPAADPDDRVGRRRARPAPAGRRRERPRRRMRDGTRHGGAARAAPAGKVVALDGSTAMIDAARERLGTERVTYLVHDLREPIPVEPVDAVLSTATFHWITDHERLFANLAAVMRPGAPLVAQCGGAGNLASVVAAASALGHDLLAAKRYAGPRRPRRSWRPPGSPMSAAGCRTSRRRCPRTSSRSTSRRSCSAARSRACRPTRAPRSSTTWRQRSMRRCWTTCG